VRAFVLIALVGLMPQECSKILGKPPPAPTQTDPPPFVPSAAPTPPPTFVQPDQGGPLPGPAPLPGPVQNPDLAKARAAVDAKDYKKVKQILAPKVKAGKASKEESQILLDACGNLKDKACVDMVRKAQPTVDQ
jgi:hypothetical protein